LGIIGSAAEVESLAASVPDTGGVFMVPAFAGLGAPHWDPYARGAVLGITRGTTAGHLARAAVESIAFQVADLARAMSADAGVPVAELRVDGGASRNDLMMQLQSDLLGTRVVRPSVTETTALGAAYLAGLAVAVAVGFFGAASGGFTELRTFFAQARDVAKARRMRRRFGVIEGGGRRPKKYVN
jgi:glycerol kinase